MLTKEIKWNYKNIKVIQKMAEKEKKGNKNQMPQIENKQPYDILTSNPINNHIKGKWSKTPQLKGRNCQI